MPEGIICTGDFALFYVGTDVVGSSSWDLINISRWVTPGWKIKRSEKGDITLMFTLSNPEGKFTYASSPDFVELRRDIPVLVSVGADVYFYGIIDKPPVDDTPDGSTATVTCVGRQALLRYEDVTKRYLIGQWDTVEDIIYDIIYEATSLNSYYDITYEKPDPQDRHPLLRDFIFNNKDVHTAINELVDFHNLRFYMDVNKFGVDRIITSRTQVENTIPVITTSFSEDNCLNFDKDRGSDVFYNRVKVVSRSDYGDVLVAEQQDVESIVAEGLHVRPTEDKGNMPSQTHLQAYAEYLIAKHSKSNYTTTIEVDPTKFDQNSLWDLRPLDTITVTHEKIGIGTDEKFVIQEVTLGGQTDQITELSIVLNHRWRNAQIMRFEETPLVYDDSQVIDDEELIHSRVMSAEVEVTGYFDIIEDDASHNYIPSDQLATGGFHGLTHTGKQVLKTNWLKDPEYSSAGVPSNPYTMRPTRIYALDANGWATYQGRDFTDGGLTATHSSPFGGEEWGQFSYVDFQQDLDIIRDHTIYGLLVCSRVGGKVTKFTGVTGAIEFIYIDNPKYLRTGMVMTLKGKNPAWPDDEEADEWTQETFTIESIDYETGEIRGNFTNIISRYDTSATFWYCEALPVAYVDYTDTPIDVIDTDSIELHWYLRFENNYDLYGETVLSLVTGLGLASIGERFDGQPDEDGGHFNEDYDGSTFWKPPTNLAIGLNETEERFSVRGGAHTTLVDEVARSTSITAGDEFVTSVSESAKVTAKFRSNTLPPKITRGVLVSDASQDDEVIFVDDTEGLEIGDAIFFSDSPTDADVPDWSYDENILSPDFVTYIGSVEASGGYSVKLRHGLLEDKKGNVTDGYTKWTTGKMNGREVKTIKEFGLFDSPTKDRDVTGYYLGDKTGVTGSAVEIQNPTDVSDSAMGFGDYQYDHLQSEDSMVKEIDSPLRPSFFSPETTGSVNYLTEVTGIGYNTIPISGMYSGSIPHILQFDQEDFYGRQFSLDKAIGRLTKVHSPLSAMNIDPLSKLSYIETMGKSTTRVKSYLPSRWRILKGATGYGKKEVFEPTWWFNDVFEAYMNEYACQLFVFSVDGEMTRQDLKQINLVWRGAAKSHDGEHFKDGIRAFIWHNGDHQPGYEQQEDGTYVETTKVGDPKTFSKHWEQIEMVRADGNDHNVTVAAGEDLNPMIILRSTFSGGGDNREGINKLGYCLNADNLMYILLMTRNKATTNPKKVSKLSTDFISLSLGTSHVFDSEVLPFRKGVDYYYDQDWNFIAWPPLDFNWDGSSWDTKYNLTRVSLITSTSDAGTSQIYTNRSPWFTPGATLLLRDAAGTKAELVTVRETSSTQDLFNPTLTAPLLNGWNRNDEVYAHLNTTTEFPVKVLNKDITPDFPARGFVRTSLASPEVTSANLTVPTFKNRITLTVSNTAGFVGTDRTVDPDIIGQDIMLWRRPDKGTEDNAGYEVLRLNTTPSSDTVLRTGKVKREQVDGDGSSYTDGAEDDYTELGVVKFDVPTLPSGIALSWVAKEGSWVEGDAAGSKWRLRTPKWGIVQYPGIEVSVSGPNYLTSSLTPDATASGFTGWGDYGGPGVKVEFYDAVNGNIWLTKARDIHLWNFNDANTDEESDKKEKVYRTVTLKDGIYSYNSQIHFWTLYTWDDDGATTAEENYFCYGWDSYNNSGALNAAYASYPLKVPRNGAIKLKSTSSNMYYQLSVAETISRSSWYNKNWKLKPKYRCLEAAGKTCVKGSTINTNDTAKTWYLDVPCFEHETHPNYRDGSGNHPSTPYDYHDEATGKVVFILDAVDLDESKSSLAMPNNTYAGDTSFTLSGEEGNIDVHEVMLLIKSGGSGYELVQVTNINGDVVTVTPPLLNDYDSADTIYWEFNELDAGHSRFYSTRLVIDATQVYGPLESGDKVTVSSNLYRAAQYTANFSREAGHMLVYSILKDYSVFRPVKSDMADTLQFIQEVKFKYLEKDMV